MVMISPRTTPIMLLMMSLMLKAREGMSFWMNSCATASRIIKATARAIRRQNREVYGGFSGPTLQRIARKVPVRYIIIWYR